MARTLAATAQTLFAACPAPRNATLLARLDRMVRLAQQRRQLATLDETRLDDLGLTTHDARREANRPFWDAPRGWRG